MKSGILIAVLFSSIQITNAQPAITNAAGERAGHAVALAAEPFPLSQVHLLDSPFRQAMARNRDYLLNLDCDRLLYNFRRNAGLPTDAKPYGGWEDPGCELRGHCVGHFLSACSLMYASTADARFFDRVGKIVSGFAECQAALGMKASHYGYLSAFPESFIDRVENRKPVWAPWYTLHKVMAGLLDASQLCGNAQALDVLTNMANWVKSRVDNLPEDKMQASLQTEFGGMNEVLANLYGVTGNEDYLKAANAFNHQRIFDPLAAGQDRLNGLHANTQIPKMIGAARQYELTGDERLSDIARFFWERVAMRRSYVIGGHSDREHFFPVNDFARHLSAETAETCNTYNMLKLTRHLFEWQPSARTMDFYERALYNDILASQDPEQGMFTYFMSLKPGHFKTYSRPDNSFWCCVGTGMENHAKYGDTIYFHNDKSLFVNLFIPSELSWHEKNLVVRQETKFPASDTTRLAFKTRSPVPLALKIRWPAWSETISVRVNGERQKISGNPGSYVSIDRTWQDGDRLEIRFAMKLRTEPLPGASNIVAVLYGPIVLAGELGTNGMPKPYARDQGDYFKVPDPKVPVFVGDLKKVLKKIKPAGAPLVFKTHGLGRPEDVTLIPFYRVSRERYSVYWRVVSAADWRKHSAEISGNAESIAAAAAPVAAEAPAATAEAQPAGANVISVTPPIRIKAGGTTGFTDSEGHAWVGDEGFDGGDVSERPDLDVANTKDPMIYRSERYSMSSFMCNLPNGKYTVKLHFAESYDGITGPGQRVFSFNVQGQVFKDFDVWARAGGPRRAYVESVPVAVTNGRLKITFTSNIENPQICGIEILPAP